MSKRVQPKEETQIVDDMAHASLKWLWRMFGASKSVLALSVLAGLVAGSCNVVLLTFINRSLEEGQKGATAIALAYFGLCFLVLLSGALSVTLLSRMAQANLCNLRLWLTRRILTASLRHLQICGAHRLMAALTDDLSSIVTAQEALPMLFIASSTLITGLLYLGFLSLRLLLLVLAFLVFGVISYQLPQQWALRWLQLAREAENALFGHFRAVTEGYKELKMDARRRRTFLDEEMSVTANVFRSRRNQAWLIYILADRWGQSLYFFLIGAILFLPPIADQIPRETLIGFTLVILFLGAPISTILHTIPAVGMGVVALKNIEALGLGTAPESEISIEGRPVSHAGKPLKLELSGVSHRYIGEVEGSGYRLGPLDLCIAPGELVFVTGGNGSGKTTLALLVLGLYPPDTGEIRLGGQLITEENREAYRQNFSAVFADSYVFDSLLGYSSADLLARAEELLVLLQLDRKLRIENGRFSTVNLSRGQRKRLALLAAYLADRPFYLFDEWAAEQDPDFREIFYREMLLELKARGKTVIVITHDDRYFHLSDRLLRLTTGQIEECPPRPAPQEQSPVQESSHV